MPVPIVLPALHPRQKEVDAHPARYKVLAAGRRWGKTRLGVTACLRIALAGGRAWWVAPTYKTARVGWRDLESAARSIPHSTIRRGEATVSFGSGGEVAVRSADTQSTLRGEGLDYVVLDEAAYIQPHTWYEEIRPSLSDRKGRALFISTPSGYNWFHELWLRGQDPEDITWMSWQYPTVSNPYIDPSEVDDARKDQTSVVFAQEYLAEFIAEGGNMFKRDWMNFFSRATINTDTGPRTYLKLGEYLTVPMEELEKFCTVDLAASEKTSADYTVVASCAIHRKTGNLIILDIFRARIPGERLIPRIKSEMERHDLGVAYIERAGFQLAIISMARAAGIPVAELTADRDKVSRAMPLAAMMEGGRVWFPQGAPWLSEFEMELVAFPIVEHDDQVDAVAYAASLMTRTRTWDAA